MKKYLLKYKEELNSLYNEEQKIYELFIEKVFETCDSIWDISEAFSYYNHDKRKEINIAKQQRKRVSSSDIHIATQFFTPEWLVKYVVDNSLGRFFPDISKDFCDGNFSFNLNCNNIRILDPAIGTGNMLLYAYDLMERGYLNNGVAKKDIPHKILQSFYGLDIDSRAVDVAKKLLLKRSGLKEFKFNIYSFCDFSSFLIRLTAEKGCKKLNKLLLDLQKTKELGSVIKIYPELNENLDIVYPFLQNEKDREVFKALKLLTQKYDVILMNPPYLSSSDYNPDLKDYIYNNYKDYKQDLFAVFIARYFSLLKKEGLLGVVCPYNWMFIKSFESLRKHIITQKGIYNLLQLSTGGYYDAVVYLSAFVCGNQKKDTGYYIRLNGFKGKQLEEHTLKAVNANVDYRYTVNQDLFLQTPYNSIIYWHNRNFIENFKNNKLSDYLEIRQGMATGNNKAFLKRIDEVASCDIAYDAVSIEDFDFKNKKYALYNKGGKYRKWYGNVDYVISFDRQSREILARQGNRMPSRDFYFKECITWTLVSSKGHFGARYSNNSVFDVGGSCGFVKHNSPVSIYVILGYLCSKVANSYLNALNPTLNIQVGDIKNLPFIVPKQKDISEIERLVKENIEISRKDWYNIQGHSFFDIMKENEQRLNEIFINLYSLDNIMDKEVDNNLITVRRLDEK